MSPSSESAASVDADPVAPRAVTSPASYGQQRLWFVHELRGGSAEYHIIDVFRLDGRLDRTALQAALDGVVRRQAVLRTRFATAGGELTQVVAPRAALPLAVEALPGLAAAEREAHVERAVTEEWEQPFALDAAPLARARLLAFSDDSHVLIVTLHHIVADGWSMGVLRHELEHGYTTARAGEDAALAPPSLQYSEFAAWQRSHFDERALERDVAYWRRQLAGLPAELGLPLDRPRRVAQPPLVPLLRATLPGATLTRLRALGVARHATLYMTLLAAFAVLLWRCSNQRDVAIASPIANRERADVERLIGLFVNTLVLRVAVEPDVTFAQLLDAVRTTALEAYEHQNVPFERVVQELSPERRLDRPPVVQVMFALQNAPSTALRLPGLDVHELPLTQARSRLDLELHATETDGELQLRWVYDGTLFDERRVARMADRWLELLAQVSEDPDVRVADLGDAIDPHGRAGCL
jgi:hypothetical protein